jgi:hypothetical protein
VGELKAVLSAAKPQLQTMNGCFGRVEWAKDVEGAGGTSNEAGADGHHPQQHQQHAATTTWMRNQRDPSQTWVARVAHDRPHALKPSSAARLPLSLRLGLGLPL